VSAANPALERLSRRLAELTGALGRRVEVADLGMLDRAGMVELGPAGHRISPNGACRMFRAADGWLALNLARPEDVDLLPAWLGETLPPGDPWTAVETLAARRPAANLVAHGILLGLPVARVGEAAPDRRGPPQLKYGPGATRSDQPLKVLDLTALWAGPLCGAVFAAMGAEVVRVESLGRPDPTRTTAPEFFRRLNGAKRELALDLTAAEGLAELAGLVRQTDVLITSARPRAFVGLGLDPVALFAARPGLVWVAITAHGLEGEAGERVGFGDDTAAAGGLVGWNIAGEPHFLGDALSDPLTGLTAAVGALEALAAGGGVMIDAAMSRCAATAAQLSGLRRAA
jgi:hypothetical protein